MGAPAHPLTAATIRLVPGGSTKLSGQALHPSVSSSKNSHEEACQIGRTGS